MNNTSKNVGLGKFGQDIENLESVCEVSFLHGLFLPFSRQETFKKKSRAGIFN